MFLIFLVKFLKGYFFLILLLKPKKKGSLFPSNLLNHPLKYLLLVFFFQFSFILQKKKQKLLNRKIMQSQTGCKLVLFSANRSNFIANFYMLVWKMKHKDLFLLFTQSDYKSIHERFLRQPWDCKQKGKATIKHMTWLKTLFKRKIECFCCVFSFSLFWFQFSWFLYLFGTTI